MKPILLPIAIAVAAGAAFGQSQPAAKLQPPPQQKPISQEEYQKKLDDKLKKPFFSKANWILDYDKAREEAKKSNKVIFTYFSRSYSP
ncbi:MAG: hypothetical protein ACKVS6_16490 [Planctomycetota bacterium]